MVQECEHLILHGFPDYIIQVLNLIKSPALHLLGEENIQLKM